MTVRLEQVKNDGVPRPRFLAALLQASGRLWRESRNFAHEELSWVETARRKSSYLCETAFPATVPPFCRNRADEVFRLHHRSGLPYVTCLILRLLWTMRTRKVRPHRPSLVAHWPAARRPTSRPPLRRARACRAPRLAWPRGRRAPRSQQHPALASTAAEGKATDQRFLIASAWAEEQHLIFMSSV